MATNQIFSDVREQRYVAEVGTKVAPGTPLILGGVPVVTVTGSGDYDGNAIKLTGNGETITLLGGRGGESLQPTQATVSPTGGWAFPVAGADETSIVAGVTKVYLGSAGTLSLTGTDDEEFGIAMFFRGETSATDTVVRIGV